MNDTMKEEAFTAIPGYTWRVDGNNREHKFAGLYDSTDKEKLFYGIVLIDWGADQRKHKAGDVYHYSGEGFGVRIARMGNVPDAVQFVVNKVLFEGV